MLVEKVPIHSRLQQPQIVFIEKLIKCRCMVFEDNDNDGNVTYGYCAFKLVDIGVRFKSTRDYSTLNKI